MNFQTSLSTLRTFPGWQDAGQTDDHPDYRDDSIVRCFSDGSVHFITDDGGLQGAIAEACLDERDIDDLDDRWDALQDVPEDSREWLLFLDQLSLREGGWQ